MLQCGAFSLLRYSKEQSMVLSSLMSFQYVWNYNIPCWFKSFLFILKIDKYHEFSLLCSKDYYKDVEASEEFFSSFL